MRTATVLSCAGLLALLLHGVPAVRADVEITTPDARTSWVGGSTVEIKWRDDRKAPSLDVFGSFSVHLCWGSNKVPMCEVPLGPVDAKFSPSMLSTKFRIPEAAGGNGDVYFVRMETVATTGGYTWNYSPRFALTGMTGEFSAAAQVEQDKGDTSAPAGTDTTGTTTTGSGGNDDDAAASARIPYTLQTGETRYAPMQTQPGTRITAKKASRLYPTSAYSLFTTKGPPPNVRTTITLPWDYVVTTAINTAAPAPDPQDDVDGDDEMRRFMMRWRD